MAMFATVDAAAALAPQWWWTTNAYVLLPLSGYLAADFGFHRSPDGADKAADQAIAKGLRVYACSSVGKSLGKSLPSSCSEERNQHDPRRCAATISRPQSAVPWQELAQPNATLRGTA